MHYFQISSKQRTTNKMNKLNIFKNSVQSSPSAKSNNKITIIGAGNAGTAITLAIATQQLVNEIFVWNRSDNRVAGEILDMKCGLGFVNNVKVNGGSDMSMSANSKVVVIAVGARKLVVENTKDLAQRNIDSIAKLIPKIVQFSPDAVIVVVTSPSDIISFAVWKLTGFPKHRIIGIGNHLHTMQWRNLIAEQLEGVSSASVNNAMILGEQGENGVAVLDQVTIAGVKVSQDNQDHLITLRDQVDKIFGRIQYSKGCHQWSIGLAAADIVKSIVHDSRDVKIVATMIKDIFAINKEVFMSVPCVIGSAGVTAIIDPRLTGDVEEKIRKSSYLMDEIQKVVNY